MENEQEAVLGFLLGLPQEIGWPMKCSHWFCVGVLNNYFGTYQHVAPVTRRAVLLEECSIDKYSTDFETFLPVESFI